MRDVLKVAPGNYYMKLQVNPMAHCKTPGDFLYLTPKYNYIIECKECKGTNFPFSRFSQKYEMDKFCDSLMRNRGFIVIMFWKGSKKKSTFYCLEEWIYNTLVSKSKKKSFNEKDLSFYGMTYEEFKELKWLK